MQVDSRYAVGSTGSFCAIFLASLKVRVSYYKYYLVVR